MLVCEFNGITVNCREELVSSRKRVKLDSVVPVPGQVGGAIRPEPRQQGVVGVVKNLLGATLPLEVTEQ